MLRTWIYTAAVAALMCAVCMALAPEGRIGKSLKFVCGLVMTAAVLSPLVGLDMETYSISAARYKLEAESILSAAEESRDSLNRRSIEEEYSAYILDKARLNGIELNEAKVTVSWCSEGYWYPFEIELVLCGGASETNTALLEAIIEAELGVPKERLSWRTENAKTD